jgi:hypothetical protein
VPLSKREDAFKEVSRLLKQGGTLNLLDIGFNNKSDMDEAKRNTEKNGMTQNNTLSSMNSASTLKMQA